MLRKFRLYYRRVLVCPTIGHRKSKEMFLIRNAVPGHPGYGYLGHQINRWCSRCDPDRERQSSIWVKF